MIEALERNIRIVFVQRLLVATRGGWFVALPGAGMSTSLHVPHRRPKSSQSQHTESSAGGDGPGGSPTRRPPRPHSIAGRVPSYASPTVSSAIRTGRSMEKKSSQVAATANANANASANSSSGGDIGNQQVCFRFSKLCVYIF